MFDPIESFHTSIRSCLIGSDNVTALVPAERIRATLIRPDTLPAILIGTPQVEYLGVAAGGQRLARVDTLLHLWTIEDADNIGGQIAAAVMQALEFGPKDSRELAFDAWERLVLAWVRDPQPSTTYMHGAISLEAVIRWRV